MENLIYPGIEQELIKLKYLNKYNDINPINCYSASHRKYFRLNPEQSSSILCLDENLSVEMINKYKLVNKIFTNLPAEIPELYHVNLDKKYLLWEDVGENSLQKIISVCHNHENEFIKMADFKIIPLLKALWLNDENYTSQLDSFALSKFFYEWEFHTNSQLVQNYLNKRLFPKFWEEMIASLFQYFIQSLQTNSVPIHRDLQSSNLFLKKEKLYVVDFQDMYAGHPLYDTVSWVFDSYVNLSMDFRFDYLENIIEKYAGDIDELREKEQLKREGLFLVIQRKLHDAGAFVFADEHLKSNHFSSYIEPAIKMAAEAAKRLNENSFILFTQALQNPDKDKFNREVFW